MSRRVKTAKKHNNRFDEANWTSNNPPEGGLLFKRFGMPTPHQKSSIHLPVNQINGNL